MNEYKKRIFLAPALAAVCFVMLVQPLLAAAPEFPEPVADDNGHYAFIREVVPILLGRKPKGALEIKLLGDIAELEGRDMLVRLLMSTEEFEIHWADQLMDILNLQRDGLRRQRDQCYDQPLRSSVSAYLAQSIRTSSPTDSVSSTPFNMRDVALSSIRADKIDALMRAHLFPLVVAGGRASGLRYKLAVGSEFSHVYLNRNMSCISCHNEVSAVSDAHTMWDRHFPVEIGLDHVLFGSYTGGPASNLNNLFRSDQVFNAENDDLDDGQYYPWGIHPSCTTDSRNSDRTGIRQPAPNSNEEVNFSGITGNSSYVRDIDQKLRDGVASLKYQGLVLVSDPEYPLSVPDSHHAALAFSVAKAFVSDVWAMVMGRELTIENYFPRTAAQRDALWNLTEEVFAPTWSLKNLLETILLTGYTDRKSPEDSVQDDPYELPMILDPWVARDPRGADAPAVTLENTRNGQGEIVRKHKPKTIMRQAARILGIEDPALFGGGQYNINFQTQLGQFISGNKPGHSGFDLQTLLTWEQKHGLCASAGSGWLSKFFAGIDQYNADNPVDPLNLRDVVQTLKDWVLQDAVIQNTPDQDLTVSEIEVLAGLFGVSANPQVAIPTLVSTYTSVIASEDELKQNLREICGAFISSPQFLLKGISINDSLVIPKFRVCNDSNNCSYEQMCESYSAILETSHGVHIDCLADSVVPGTPPDDNGQSFDPEIVCRDNPHTCIMTELPNCLDLSISPQGPPSIGPDCPVDVPRCDIRCGLLERPLERLMRGQLLTQPGGRSSGGGELGLRCCGTTPDFNSLYPRDILGWLEGNLVTNANDVYVMPLDGEPAVELESGDTLQFGSVVYMPPGASLEVRDQSNSYRFGGKRGVSSAAERQTSKLDRKMIAGLEKKDYQYVKEIVSKGANINAITTDGQSVLNASIERGDTQAVKMLIELGADLNFRDARGNLPLTVAANFGLREIAKLLRSVGATFDEKRDKYQQFEIAHKIMITGPSAAKAPHPRGGKYVSEIERGRPKYIPLSTKERLAIHIQNGHLDSGVRTEEEIRKEDRGDGVNIEYPVSDNEKR